MTTEAEYLRNYNQKDFQSPLLSVDTVLFTLHEDELKVLLVKRSSHPYQDRWGLPGGFVDFETDDCLRDTAIRKIVEKTCVKPPYLEQFDTVGSKDRDKRGWSVTVCYSALISYQECEAGIHTVSDAAWFDLDTIRKTELAFDHINIIESAREMFKQKALYSIIPAYALSKSFTLPELQHVHEVLVEKKLQKKSFRRRIEQADLLIEKGQKKADKGRPATLYEIKPSAKEYTFVRNLED